MPQINKTRTIGRIVLFLILCFIGSVLISAPFVLLTVSKNGNQRTELIPNLMILAYSTFILLALFIENKIEKLELWSIAKCTLQTKVVMAAVSLGVLWQLVALLLCKISGEAFPFSTNEGTLSLILSIIAMGLLGPFVEEMLFRKWLVDMMERVGFKPAVMIIVSSVLFFCMHLGDSFVRIDALSFSVPITYLYIKYHDVRYCVLAHTVCNMMGIIISVIS